MNVLCIFNPKAGGGKASKQLSHIKQLFIKYQINAEIVQTQYPHHGTEILAQKNINNYDALIAAGGDGSFFDLLNGYMKYHYNTPVPLGIIPVGTGNSLSRDVINNLKNNNLENFVKLIKLRHSKTFDIGKITTSQQVYYFVNMMGFGFTTDVTLTANKYKFFKSAAYIIGVLLNTLRLKTYPLEIEIDKQKQQVYNTFVTVSNSKYTGNDFLIAPHAKVNDGLLDVVIVNKISRLNLLKTFPKIFDGSYINSPYVNYQQVKKINFYSEQHKIISPDGEITGQLPVKIEVLPRAVSILSE